MTGSDAAKSGRQQPIDARIGPYDLAVSVEGEASLRVDSAGRWGSMRWRDAFWRRTVGSAVVRHRGTAIRDLAPAETRAVHLRARELAAALAGSIGAGRAPVRLHGPESVSPASGKEVLIERLEAAARWTPERHAAEAARFRAAYPEGVPILPPDRLRDLVVLATLGCPWGRCDFCAFYRDRPFHILTREELDAHLAAVSGLFGEAIALRQGLFLGSANALALSQGRLVSLLERLQRHVGSPGRGVAAFWDPDHAPARTVRDFEELAGLGMRRLVVGLETGDPRLRRRLGKRGEPARIAACVREQKAGGIACGLVVLAGPGGSAAAVRHREETASVLESIELDPRDLVYVSPLERDMPVAALLEETGRLRSLLAARLEARVVPYRMDRFRYWA